MGFVAIRTPTPLSRKVNGTAALFVRVAGATKHAGRTLAKLGIEAGVGVVTLPTVRYVTSEVPIIGRNSRGSGVFALDHVAL